MNDTVSAAPGPHIQLNPEDKFVAAVIDGANPTGFRVYINGMTAKETAALLAATLSSVIMHIEESRIAVPKVSLQ